MKTLYCDVIIVGAGVAGSFLACNLRFSGLKVILVEFNKKIPNVNKGDQVAPCTVRMLSEIGALPNFEKRGSVKIKKWQVLGPERKLLLHLPIAMTTSPPYNYIMALPHPKIQESLLETALEGDSVELIRRFRVTGLVRDDAGMVCGVQGSRDNEDYQINARFVAGCDGIKSKVRDWAGITTSTEQYPREYAMLTCSRNELQDPEVQIEVWGEKGFGGFFPIEENIVRCPVPIPPGEITRWREIGRGKVREELEEKYPYYSGMEILDRDLHSYRVFMHNAQSYVSDGVAILGDAAHATSPYYGMGMNMAMRDGYYLSNLITGLLKKSKLPTVEALKPYEDSCRNFNQFVIEASNAYGKVAAAQHQTIEEVHSALRSSPALDANVMNIIYADYQTPPPSVPDPEAVSKQWRGEHAAVLGFKVVLEDLGYVESLQWYDNELWFVDSYSKKVQVLETSGRARAICEVPGTPRGLGFLEDGTRLIVSQDDFKLMRIEDSGELSEYADLSKFARGAANDVVADKHGRCYVGHHSFDFFDGDPLEPASLMMVNTDGSVKEVTDNLIFPKGMVITEDEKTLIVAEKFGNRLTAFDIVDDGNLANRRVWAQLGLQWTPDGICMDAEGAIWVGNPLAGAFIRIKEGGEITHKVYVEPSWAVCCSLGGKENQTLYGVVAETTIDDMPRGICTGRIITVDIE